MKVVALGGSAQSTPNLWTYLVGEAGVQGLRMILAGRSLDRLTAVKRACQILAPSKQNSIEVSLIEDVTNADVFLVQVRNGGYAGRSFDESFPRRYGICGDEGLGPGGLSAGIRNWQAIRPLLERIQRLSPKSLVLMMSSPVGLLVRAARLRFPKLRVSGICELPWTTLTEICSSVSVDPRKVDFDYFGINHLGWFYRIAEGRRDILAEYAELRVTAPDFPSARLIRNCGGAPLPYLRLHYEPKAVLDYQSIQAPRGEALERLNRAAFCAYSTGARAEIESALRSRPAPWYRHAVGPLLAALIRRDGNAGIPLFLSNHVQEHAHVLEDGRLRRLRATTPIPGHILELTSRFVNYEHHACKALLSGAASDLEDALRRHPWVGQHLSIAGLVSEMCTQYD